MVPEEAPSDEDSVRLSGVASELAVIVALLPIVLVPGRLPLEIVAEADPPVQPEENPKLPPPEFPLTVPETV